MQVLLLSRLCSILASNSTSLPLLLGPPDAWVSALNPTARGVPSSSLGPSWGRSSSTLGLGPASAALLRQQQQQGALGGGFGEGAGGRGQLTKLRQLQKEMRGVANMGYSVWAAWAAECLVADLAAALAEDELLKGGGVPLSWVETVVGAGGGEGGGVGGEEYGLDDVGGEMRFALPAAPSPAVMTCLMRATWVSGRGGGRGGRGRRGEGEVWRQEERRGGGGGGRGGGGRGGRGGERQREGRGEEGGEREGEGRDRDRGGERLGGRSREKECGAKHVKRMCIGQG